MRRVARSARARRSLGAHARRRCGASSTPPASSSTPTSAARRWPPRRSTQMRVGSRRATPISSTTSTRRRAAIGTCTPSACCASSPAPRRRSSSTTTRRRRCSSLAALAAGREVIVSRGELVEIGGGFRVPDVMAQSGAIAARGRHDQPHARRRLRRGDQRSHGAACCACTRPTSASRASPSGRRSPTSPRSRAGSASRSSRISAAAGSGRRRRAPAALADEPSVRASLAAGADLVAFSGDKLLGGPQAGIIVGRRDLVDASRRHPLMRALRADKLDLRRARSDAGAVVRSAPSRREIPVYRMLTMTRRRDQIARPRAGGRRSSVRGLTLRT